MLPVYLKKHLESSEVLPAHLNECGLVVLSSASCSGFASPIGKGESTDIAETPLGSDLCEYYRMLDPDCTHLASALKAILLSFICKSR